MADGRIIIDTEIDSKGAEKGVSGLGNKLGSIAKTGLKVFTGAIAGVSTALGGLGAIGVKYNAELEQYMSSFTTMLGSAEKATNHLNDLKEFAAKTPFELSDLAKASTTLQAFGADVKDINPTLKMLGDISLGNKEKFNGLALVFGQVQSQGKLMGNDLMQMINNGFNPLQVMSEKTGKSMSQLKDEMSKGQISFEMVADAMKTATNEGGKFYNAMEGQSKTLVGQWSTLKDNAKALTGELFTSISDGLKNTVLPTVNGYIDTLSKTFKEKGITGLVGAVGDIAANIITEVANYLPRVIDLAVQIIQSFVIGIQNNLPQIVSAAVQILNSLVTGILKMLPQILKMGIDIIVQLALGIAKQLPTLIPLAIDCILTLVQELINNLPLILNAGLQLLEGLTTGLINALPILIASLPQIIQSLVNFISKSLPQILQSGLTILLALIDGLVQCLPQLIAMLPQIINTILDFVTQNLPQIIDMGIKVLLALIDGLINAIPQLIGMLPQIITSITNTLIQRLPDIIKAGIQILIALIKGLTQAIPKLIEAIPTIVSAIFNAFKDVSWGEIGTNIVKGVWEGIKGMASWIANKVGGFFTGILDGAKKVLGIHSPSRIFRDQVGAMMAQGVGVGFEDEYKDVENSIDKQLSDMVSSFNVDEVTAKMTATVYAEQAKVNGSITARNDYSTSKDNTNTATTSKDKVVIEVPVIVEGREVARAVAPYQDVLTDYSKGR